MANPDEKKEFLRRMLLLMKDGMTNEEVARQFGVTVEKINYSLRQVRANRKKGTVVRGVWFVLLELFLLPEDDPQRTDLTDDEIMRQVFDQYDRDVDNGFEGVSGLRTEKEKKTMNKSAGRALARLDALEGQAEQMHTLALAQGNVVDQYNAMLAMDITKKMRDGLKQMKPPRTVNELDTLDKLFRRCMGVEKGAGAGGTTPRIQIDLTLLNNPLADRSNTTVKSLNMSHRKYRQKNEQETEAELVE